MQLNFLTLKDTTKKLVIFELLNVNELNKHYINYQLSKGN